MEIPKFSTIYQLHTQQIHFSARKVYHINHHENISSVQAEIYHMKVQIRSMLL